MSGGRAIVSVLTITFLIQTAQQFLLIRWAVGEWDGNETKDARKYAKYAYFLQMLHVIFAFTLSIITVNFNANQIVDPLTLHLNEEGKVFNVIVSFLIGLGILGIGMSYYLY